MSYGNYRGRIAEALSRGGRREYRGIFYRGSRFWAADEVARKRAEKPWPEGVTV